MFVTGFAGNVILSNSDAGDGDGVNVLTKAFALGAVGAKVLNLTIEHQQHAVID